MFLFTGVVCTSTSGLTLTAYFNPVATLSAVSLGDKLFHTQDEKYLVYDLAPGAFGRILVGISDERELIKTRTDFVLRPRKKYKRKQSCHFYIKIIQKFVFLLRMLFIIFTAHLMLLDDVWNLSYIITYLNMLIMNYTILVATSKSLLSLQCQIPTERRI